MQASLRGGSRAVPESFAWEGPELYPDPVVTANIYCLHGLDEVIRQVIAPFWHRFRAEDPDQLCDLWLLRYSKCGDHLKVRLHGPEVQAPRMRQLLQDAAESFLTSLGPPGDEPPPQRWKNVPPVDVEDQAEAHYPDRTFLWTEYRRSDVSLGRKPLLLDDRYTALFTHCLGRATERVLAAFAAHGGDKIPHSLRQTTLWRGVIAGLAALGFPAERRAAYLVYHRDWLLRFGLVKSGIPSENATGVLARFDERVEKMGSSLDAVRHTAAGQWSAGGGSLEPDSGWREALRDLLHYVTGLCSDSAYHVDPFAPDPVFTPFFKVFHGFANQLGLNMFDEALAYHVLLCATAPEAVERGQISLVGG